MIKRLCALIVLGVMMSGCFMAPLALVGPAASGFSTASLVQSGIGATGNYLIKQGTGKTVSEHVIDVLDIEVMQQSYFPRVTKKYKSINPH